jgi:hypothetical protein
MKRFLVLGVILAQMCGIPPIPPIPPVGCKEMVPVCQCSGTRCWWTFQCVPS